MHALNLGIIIGEKCNKVFCIAWICATRRQLQLFIFETREAFIGYLSFYYFLMNQFIPALYSVENSTWSRGAISYCATSRNALNSYISSTGRDTVSLYGRKAPLTSTTRACFFRLHAVDRVRHPLRSSLNIGRLCRWAPLMSHSAPQRAHQISIRGLQRYNRANTLRFELSEIPDVADNILSTSCAMVSSTSNSVQVLLRCRAQ